MTKDMTKQQFADALKRNGFKRSPMPLWPAFVDTTGALNNHVEFGSTVDRHGRLRRRATIAHLISSRRRMVDEQRRGGK